MKIVIQYDDGLPFASHAIDRKDAGAWRALFEGSKSRSTAFSGTEADDRARGFAEDLVRAIRAAEINLESGPTPPAEPVESVADEEIFENAPEVSLDRPESALKARRMDQAIGALRDAYLHLLKLQRGDYGLTKTYWVFGWAVTLAVLVATAALGMYAFPLVGVHVVYSGFAGVGIWKAARRYRGRRLWRALALCSIPLLAITVLSETLMVLSL